MGLVLSVVSRFRKKKTRKELLEQIDEDIEKMELALQRNRQLQKSTVLSLLTISVLAYLLAATIFYLWYLPTKWIDRCLYFLPFLGFPLLVFFLKKVLHFIFVTRISRIGNSLQDLKKQKKKILENVMEAETYKVAKEILQKFDPSRKLVERDTPTKETPPNTPGQELRKRNIPAAGNSNQTPIKQMERSISVPTGQLKTTPFIAGTPQPIHMHTTSPMQLRFQTPQMKVQTPRLPNAPILPRDRSFFDKVAEYFVGDGPNNRFALVCQQCYSHNGMALAEEFEFISYKCCYCGFFNPGRKRRLNAPKLERSISDPMPSVEEDSTPSVKEISSVEENSRDETEGEDTTDVDQEKKESKAEDLTNESDERLSQDENELKEKNGEMS